MKKNIFIVLMLMASLAMAQTPEGEQLKSGDGDVERGIRIVDKYLSMVDFQQEKTDSILFVESKIIDRSHPNDTMTIYRWYMRPHYMRVEIWQDGKIEDGYYTDGTTIFRKFRPSQRTWDIMPQDNFCDRTIPLDIRGALYDWRSKGAEISYAGEYTFKGQQVDRVFVRNPNVFDRYYFFEKNTGLLFMLTELETTFGDAEVAHNAVRVDWRAWNEFTPVHHFMMPSIESYQFGNQVVVIRHKYRYLPHQVKIFTEDYHAKP